MAKSIGLALNDDNELISWDGTFWKQKSNNSNYVKNHTLTGNSYTIIVNEALKPTYAIAWSKGSSIWYDNCSGGMRSWSNANSYCINRGMRLAEINESDVRITEGIPSCLNSTTPTWTKTSEDGTGRTYLVWKSPSGAWGQNNNTSASALTRCVK